MDNGDRIAVGWLGNLIFRRRVSNLCMLDAYFFFETFLVVLIDEDWISNTDVLFTRVEFQECYSKFLMK